MKWKLTAEWCIEAGDTKIKRNKDLEETKAWRAMQRLCVTGKKDACRSKC